MSYLIDTNACIAFLRGQNPVVRRRFEALSPDDIHLCLIVTAELLVGALKSNDPERALARLAAFLPAFGSLPFDDGAAETYSRIRVYLERLGTPIGPHDFQIAAIALAHDRTLVTRNTAEFSRVPGLRLENWEIASD